MTDHVARLIGEEALDPDYADLAERWWRPLAGMVAARHAADGHPILVGINGPQGSGKSTLCRFLEALLDHEHGLHAATLSLDDLYLTRAERQAKAERVHPLFVTRGVPGTHDGHLGLDVIASVLAGRTPLLPRFDKAADDRAPVEEWHRLDRPVDVLLFEGWCLGARPQAPEALAEPVNRLEREEDADGRWRTLVNDALVSPYNALFGPMTMLVMLRPPSFDQVRGWRRTQEDKLIARTGQGMDPAALDRFVEHYERLTRHMLATLPAIADVVVEIDADHRVAGLSGPACPAPPAAP